MAFIVGSKKGLLCKDFALILGLVGGFNKNTLLWFQDPLLSINYTPNTMTLEFYLCFYSTGALKDINLVMPDNTTNINIKSLFNTT